jgi:hypothetical protein
LNEATREKDLFPCSCPIEQIIAALDHPVYAAWVLVGDGEVIAKQALRLTWKTLTAGVGNSGS